MTNVRARITKRKIKNVKSRRDIKRKRSSSKKFAGKKSRTIVSTDIKKSELEERKMNTIYKYFTHDVISLVFDREGFCGVKCSLPKNYNDPFELFLGMDLNVPAEQLAFYNDVVQGIPQNPTTCFSKSPIVSPMWAHYANNHSGFVLEFDLDKLKKHFEGNPIWDVNYREGPLSSLKDMLERAAVLMKPRYSFLLQQAVYTESYFSKYKEWEYEKECRFVDMSGVTECIGVNDILFIPIDAVRSVIAGPRSSAEAVEITREVADKNGMNWFQVQIGKSHPEPYLKDDADNNYTFTTGEISKHEKKCEGCAEPLFERESLCPWCSITGADREAAAQGNPFRRLDEAGLLEDYMKSMSNIGKDG